MGRDSDALYLLQFGSSYTGYRVVFLSGTRRLHHSVCTRCVQSCVLHETSVHAPRDKNFETSTLHALVMRLSDIKVLRITPAVWAAPVPCNVTL